MTASPAPAPKRDLDHVGQILGGVAGAAYCRTMAVYRRRPDGILEIVRARRPSRVSSVISTIGAGLSLALVPLVALTVYVSMGMPLVLVAAGLLVTLVAWRELRRRTAAAAPRAEPPRLAPVGGRGAPAHLGAQRP